MCYRTAPQRGTRRVARYAEASGWRVTHGPGRPAPPQPPEPRFRAALASEVGSVRE